MHSFRLLALAFALWWGCAVSDPSAFTLQHFDTVINRETMWGANLITNGSFETGDLTGWTNSGAGNWTVDDFLIGGPTAEGGYFVYGSTPPRWPGIRFHNLCDGIRPPIFGQSIYSFRFFCLCFPLRVHGIASYSL